jgi:Na+/melibiose symporter-like transporter
MKRDTVLRIAAFLQITGAWLRYGVKISDGFWWVLLGSYVNQAATPIFLNAVSITSTVWFDDKQRNLSTSLSSLSYVAGALFCLTITGIITGNLDEGTSNLEDVRNDTYSIIFVQNMIITITAGLFFILIKEKPSIPPTEEIGTNFFDFGQDVKELWANKNYKFLLFSFSLLFGCYITFGNLLDPLFGPFGYSSG